MMPIAENGETTLIIAARNDDEALATDIDVVLYEKMADGWAGSAYDPSVTKEDAMIDLANEFGLPDPFGGDWHIDLDIVDVLDYVLPRVGFGKGFFVTDPLFEIANHITDPNPLASAAEDAGQPAGSGGAVTGSAPVTGVGDGGSNGGFPIPTDCGCDACFQDMLKLGADVYLAGGAQPFEDAEEAMNDYAELLLPCCRRRTTSTIISTPWTCGPWLSDPPVPNPLLPSSFSCNYSRTAARTQTKKSIRRCWDCVRCTWTETRTQRGTQAFTALITVLPPATPSCPNPPVGAPPCGATPDSNGPWQPGAGTPCC